MLITVSLSHFEFPGYRIQVRKCAQVLDRMGVQMSSMVFAEMLQSTASGHVPRFHRFYLRLPIFHRLSHQNYLVYHLLFVPIEFGLSFFCQLHDMLSRAIARKYVKTCFLTVNSQGSIRYRRC